MVAPGSVDVITEAMEEALEQHHPLPKFMGGPTVQELADWATIHERAPPLSMIDVGHRKICPVRGQDSNVIYRGVFIPERLSLNEPTSLQVRRRAPAAFN